MIVDVYRGRIPKSAQAPPPDLMTDAVADVRHGPGDRHDERQIADASDDLDEIHTCAARRNRISPIAVKIMFGTHAQRAASPMNASAANEQTVITT